MALKSKLNVTKNQKQKMATKNEKPDLAARLSKAEEDFKASKNGLDAIETLKTFKSVGSNQRFKALLDNSVKLISELQQTINIILTIATLYYEQSDDKTSVGWLLKYLTKVKLETSLRECEKKEKSLIAEYMLGCCFYNLNNYKMAYKSLKTSPPDPSNVSKYQKHCNMLIMSCHALQLWNEMVKYKELCNNQNQSAQFNVTIRINNANQLILIGKTSGAKIHLKEASTILLQCQDEQKLWEPIAAIYRDLKMYREAYKCNQNFVDAFKDQSLDPPSDKLLKILLQMASDDNYFLGHYERAISKCQYVLELFQKAPESTIGYKLQAICTMADSYFFLNDFQLTIKHYEQVLVEMKQAYSEKDSSVNMDYCHLSRVWLMLSRSQLLSGNFQKALKSANKSVKYLKRAPGKFPREDADTAKQLSYCWRKLENPQKASMFMSSAVTIWKKNQLEEMDYIDTKMIFIGACKHQLSGTFGQIDSLIKTFLLQNASKPLEQVMNKLHFCVKGFIKIRNYFPEDGQLFWSRLNKMYCNDADFVSKLPNGFEKCFFLYKNSLECCNHLKKQ
jgi:tetratricopeptide (TPR) repeat protein